MPGATVESGAADPVLLLLLIALGTTIGAFALDIFPYPFGILVLTVLLLGRVLARRGTPRPGSGS